MQRRRVSLSCCDERLGIGHIWAKLGSGKFSPVSESVCAVWDLGRFILPNDLLSFLLNSVLDLPSGMAQLGFVFSLYNQSSNVLVLDSALNWWGTSEISQWVFSLAPCNVWENECSVDICCSFWPRLFQVPVEGTVWHRRSLARHGWKSLFCKLNMVPEGSRLLRIQTELSSYLKDTPSEWRSRDFAESFLGLGGTSWFLAEICDMATEIYLFWDLCLDQ